MSGSLDYAGLLALARKEADSEIEFSWPPDVRCNMGPYARAKLDQIRNKRVVRKFLELICPIRVEEVE
jgi:hypothetical protein